MTENADQSEGMRLFATWFQSGDSTDSLSHRSFLAWGDLDAREAIRDLYQIAHNPAEEPIR